MNAQEAGIEARLILNPYNGFFAVYKGRCSWERIEQDDFRHELLHRAFFTNDFRLTAHVIMLISEKLKVLAVKTLPTGNRRTILAFIAAADVEVIVDEKALTQSLAERISSVCINEITSENVCPRLEWERPGKAHHAILTHDGSSRTISQRIPKANASRT